MNKSLRSLNQVPVVVMTAALLGCTAPQTPPIENMRGNITASVGATVRGTAFSSCDRTDYSHTEYSYKVSACQRGASDTADTGCEGSCRVIELYNLESNYMFRDEFRCYDWDYLQVELGAGEGACAQWGGVELTTVDLEISEGEGHFGDLDLSVYFDVILDDDTENDSDRTSMDIKYAGWTPTSEPCVSALD